ncbi:MAG: TolC family protein [Verrucomicrobiota bacterium]
MKSFSVLLVFILAALTAAAQTDTNAVAAQADTNAIVVPADTNAPAVPSTTNGVAVQTDTNAIAAQAETNAFATQPGTNTGAVQTNTMAPAAPTGRTATTREMSLVDCIQEALQCNFDLQIRRYDPQFYLYSLRSDYGDYDPTFNLSGTHGYNTTDGLLTNGFNSIITISTNTSKTNFVLFPRTSGKNNVFASDLGASLPWGLDYKFVANLEQDYGTTFSGTTNRNSYLAKNTYDSVEVDLTQHLLKDFWIDTTRLNIRVAKNRLKYSEQSLRQQFITTITAVENAYYELIFARENVRVQQEALDLAQTQLDQDKQRVQIGTLAQLDVQQDEAQVAQSRANLITAQYTLVTDQNALKNLITDNYPSWHDLAVEPTETITNASLQLFDLQDSWSKGLTERPDLVQSRLDAEKQGIQLKFDRNQLFPALDLVGSYGYAGDARDYDGAFDETGRGDAPYYTYGAKLSYPLGNIKARNTYKADKVTEKQYLLTLKQLEQTIMVQIDNAVKQAQSAYESVGATRQARIYAEAALDAEQKKYAVGKSTTFTVLQLQNTLTADRGQEIRSLANYYEALVNLAQQEGSTLERNHINIEAK